MSTKSTSGHRSCNNLIIRLHKGNDVATFVKCLTPLENAFFWLSFPRRNGMPSHMIFSVQHCVNMLTMMSTHGNVMNSFNVNELKVHIENAHFLRLIILNNIMRELMQT